MDMNARRWQHYVALMSKFLTTVSSYREFDILPWRSIWLAAVMHRPLLSRPLSEHDFPKMRCFIIGSQALQNNLAKIYNARNHIFDENVKLKFCTCTQSMVWGKHTKFQLEIIIWSTISAIHTFRENIFGSTRVVSETTPGTHFRKIVSKNSRRPGARDMFT